MTGYDCLAANLKAMQGVRDAILNDERITSLQAPELSQALQCIMDCIEDTALILEGK